MGSHCGMYGAVDPVEAVRSRRGVRSDFQWARGVLMLDDLGRLKSSVSSRATQGETPKGLSYPVDG